jgi:hypothetical protein
MPGGSQELPNFGSALAPTHFAQHKEQPCILFLNLFSTGYHGNFSWKMKLGLTKSGMPAGAELSVFERPNGILHCARHSLDAQDISEEVFTPLQKR